MDRWMGSHSLGLTPSPLCVRRLCAILVSRFSTGTVETAKNRKYFLGGLRPCEERAGHRPTNGLAPSLGPKPKGLAIRGPVDWLNVLTTCEESSRWQNVETGCRQVRALPDGEHQAQLCDAVLEHAIDDSSFFALAQWFASHN